MTYHEEIIRTINCFSIQKVSNHGAIVLYQSRITFVYENGVEDLDFDFMYSDISDVRVEAGYLRATDILKIDANEKTFQFNGIKEIEEVKHLINLLKQHNSNPEIDYGFRNMGVKKREWKDIEDPILLCSYQLPANMKTVTEIMMGEDFFVELYTACESENIIIDEWNQKDDYKERTIHYQKTINIPFMGKSIIQIAETQLLYNFPNKMAIEIVSDLGKTPFADCFDPQAQLIFEDKGDTVDFLVNYKMVWVKEPAFKNIIDSRTTEANRVFYQGFGKQLLRELGASDGKNDADKKNGESNEKTENVEKTDEPDESEKEAMHYAKLKMIYKLIIIVLLLMLIFAFLHRYKKTEPIFFSFWKFVNLTVFIILLINF